MEKSDLEGKVLRNIGNETIDRSDEIKKEVLLYGNSKLCVFNFKREESIDVIDVNNNEEDYNVDTPQRKGNYCYKNYPHCQLCCGCSDYIHVDGNENYEFKAVGVSPFESEFIVSYGSIVASYFESSYDNKYEEYNNIDETNWCIIDVCFIAKDLIAMCDEDGDILIYDSLLSDKKGIVKYKASTLVPLINHNDNNNQSLFCALDNDKCVLCDYSEFAVLTVYQFNENIIMGYELQQDNLMAIVCDKNIYILSLETFQITNEISIYQDCINQCSIVPNRDDICLLLNDNSIWFANCERLDMRELLIEEEDYNQKISNVIAVDDMNIIRIKDDNTIDVIEYE